MGRVVITGGLGFIGSAVVKKALELGHVVKNVDVMTYAGSMDNVLSISNNENYSFSKVDIKNYKKIYEIFTDFQPDAVIHLAAESHVDRSIDNPEEFLNTNILGTYSLLEAARKYWSDSGEFESFKFLHVSTDEVYGELGHNGKFKETSPYNPNSPYSSSKAAGDHLVRAWLKTYNLPTLITHSSNNYGPFQYPEKLIPITILNAMNWKKIPIYGEGKNVRDWLFVNDNAKGILKVLAFGKIGENYNLGGESERTNLEVVKIICNIMDKVRPMKEKHSELISFVSDRKGHDFRYALDISKVRKEVNWSPITILENGIHETVKWYLSNIDWVEKILQKRDL